MEGIKLLETFTSFRKPVANPAFERQRQRTLARLDLATIDAPIVTLVSHLNQLPYCFSLQSCWGHFVSAEQRDPRNVRRLPRILGDTYVTYRIAYLALCVDINDHGMSLLSDLGEIPAIDPDYVQFGCADWFWRRQVNSYALQVEPRRYQTRDVVHVEYEEALHLQEVRDAVFSAVERLLDARF